VDEYEKDSARDFALWKAAKPGETSWETAIGRGRPGWHIECSAMAMEYLGESFDLHAGGEDLMFPHHENEIAQSESVTHKPFARHWMHVRFLLVDGRKMSKSEGNFYTLRDLLLKGYKASAIRLALISVPYRHQLNFTFDGLIEATNAIERLRTFHQRLTTGSFAPGENPALQAAAKKAQADYMAALANDLNTAEARAPIFDLVRAANTAIDQGQLFKAGDRDAILAVLASFDAVFDAQAAHDAHPGHGDLSLHDDAVRGGPRVQRARAGRGAHRRPQDLSRHAARRLGRRAQGQGHLPGRAPSATSCRASRCPTATSRCWWRAWSAPSPSR
jgi:cysteinyl-tRNA synthetase